MKHIRRLIGAPQEIWDGVDKEAKRLGLNASATVRFMLTHCLNGGRGGKKEGK